MTAPQLCWVVARVSCVCVPPEQDRFHFHTSDQSPQLTSHQQQTSTDQHMASDWRPGQGCPASFKLLGHVLQKGFEAGGLIGGFAVVPATAAYTTYIKKEKMDVLELAKNAAFATIAGVGLSGERGAWDVGRGVCTACNPSDASGCAPLTCWIHPPWSLSERVHLGPSSIGSPW